MDVPYKIEVGDGAIGLELFVMDADEGFGPTLCQAQVDLDNAGGYPDAVDTGSDIGLFKAPGVALPKDWGGCSVAGSEADAVCQVRIGQSGEGDGIPAVHELLVSGIDQQVVE